MRIKTKLIVGFSIIALLILLTVLIAIFSSKTVQETFYELEEDIIPGAIAMGDMEGYIHEVKAIIFSYVIKENNSSIYFEKSGKECLLETIESLEAVAAKHKAHEVHIGIEEQKAAEELELKITKLSFAVLKIIELKDQGEDRDTLLNYFAENVCPYFMPLVDQIKEHKAIHMQELESATESISKTQEFSNKIILVFCVIIIILAFITNRWVSFSITKPLSRLAKGVEMIGKGDMNHKINIKSNDEIADLATAFNKMTNDLIKSKKDLKKYNQKLEKSVQERTKELQSKMKELERFNRIMVDRELKMIDLKKKIKELEANQ
ncbi:MAG: HAMP domain-containing protein [Nanoarchaeota archaeon]|nr:HAMP domain-containing protein [Nanoarchaeota archaeon]